MLNLDDIKVEFECQGFKGTHLGISPEKDKTVMFMESVRSTRLVHCPFCGGSVNIYENAQVNLKIYLPHRVHSQYPVQLFFVHRIFLVEKGES